MTIWQANQKTNVIALLPILLVGTSCKRPEPTSTEPTPIETAPIQWHAKSERKGDVELKTAIRSGNIDAIKAALVHGADPNGAKNFDAPIVLALDQPPKTALAIVQSLVDNGAAVNFVDEPQGWSPLTYAIARSDDYSQVAHFLISKGANINATMDDGLTPLALAVRFEKRLVVIELLENKAKLEARTIDRYSRMSNQMIKANAQNPYGCEPGYRQSGQTPVFELAAKWNDQIADALTKAGANFRATDENGWSALHHAMITRQPAAVRGLLARELDPNAKSNGGFDLPQS